MSVRFLVITWKVVSLPDAYMCVISFGHNTIEVFLSMDKQLCHNTPGLSCNYLGFINIEFQFLLDVGGEGSEAN